MHEARHTGKAVATDMEMAALPDDFKRKQAAQDPAPRNVETGIGIPVGRQ